jgi:hypothetical protein
MNTYTLVNDADRMGSNNRIMTGERMGIERLNM